MPNILISPISFTGVTIHRHPELSDLSVTDRSARYIIETGQFSVHMKFAPQSFSLKPTIEMEKSTFRRTGVGRLNNPVIPVQLDQGRAIPDDYDAGIYTTLVERALDNVARHLVSDVVVYPKWDLAHLPASFRPFLAWELHADAYTTLLDSLYGESREVALIRGAAKLNRLRGTKAAFDEFAAAAQFSYQMQYVRTDVGGINKVTAVNVAVVPALASLSANTEWLEYIVRVMGNLLPVFIDLNRVTIENSIASRVNIFAGFNPFQFEVFS